jgi:hypothetical protein
MLRSRPPYWNIARKDPFRLGQSDGVTDREPTLRSPARTPFYRMSNALAKVANPAKPLVSIEDFAVAAAANLANRPSRFRTLRMNLRKHKALFHKDFRGIRTIRNDPSATDSSAHRDSGDGAGAEPFDPLTGGIDDLIQSHRLCWLCWLWPGVAASACIASSLALLRL